MWSDIKENHNKFYVAQALKHSNGKFYLWTRYGRVGLDGVGSPIELPTEQHAIREYTKKYNQKTSKGYTEVKLALGNPKANHIDVKIEETKNAPSTKKVKGPKSKLDTSL